MQSFCYLIRVPEFWEVDCRYNLPRESALGTTDLSKGVLAIRRIFSLVDMITKPKFSNCPNVFKMGLFW